MRFVPKALDETADVSRGRSSWKTILKNVLSVIIFFVAVYFVLGLIGVGLSEFIPDSWERRLAFSVDALTTVKDADRSSLREAEAILKKLTEEVSLRELEYRLFLLDIDAPNAVAVPGGGIGLSPPLMEMLKTEEGLAFVIAHELGHHQHRHILRRLGRALTIGVVAALTISNYDLSTIETTIAVAEKGYSRKQERQADEFALRLVFSKYGDDTNALEFFNALLEERSDPLWRKYLGTHPITEDRIASMRELADQIR